ncbi:MAG TPA: helix-turn-helix transcriptional regulator [Sphingobacteriaceae bacterium]|nr:helix-turn-helix transcriptional regulator [Sphingobacteriaceae bacterium]
MDLGSIIKNIRKQKGLTQSEFASLSGITQTYLSQIEGNLKEPNLSTLKVISEKLNMPLPILFFLSMTKDDIQSNKRQAFKDISLSVKSVVDEFFPV